MALTAVDLKNLVLARLKASAPYVDDNDLLAYTNYYIDEFTRHAIRLDTPMFLTTVVRDLDSSTREYELSTISTFLKVRNVFANLKGDVNKPDNWVRLREVSNAYTNIADDDENKMAELFDLSTNVFYEHRGSKIFLYTAPGYVSVTNGLKIEVETNGFIHLPDTSVFTSSSPVSLQDLTGIPAQLHTILADAVSYAMKTSGDKTVPILPEEQAWESRLVDELMRWDNSNAHKEWKVVMPPLEY